MVGHGPTTPPLTGHPLRSWLVWRWALKNLWRNYSLSLVAGVLFLLTWVAFGVIKWFDHRYELSLMGTAGTTRCGSWR
jgi:hypothetical protein